MTALPIPPSKTGNPPVPILAKHLYWDVVHARFTKPLNANDLTFVGKNSGSIKYRTDIPLPDWPYWLSLKQPNDRALRYLDRKFGKDVLINRIESTVDLITTDSASAEVLKRFLDNHLIQKNRRARQLGGFDGTSYWCKERWVTRQPVVYVPPGGSKK